MKHKVDFFFQEEPQLVSLHWLLEEVSRQMAQVGGATSRFIIDIMPNLKFLINNDIFLADCTDDMKSFELKVGASPSTVLTIGIALSKRLVLVRPLY